MYTPTQKASVEKWRKANPEHYKANRKIENKRWRERHREEIAAYKRLHRAANKASYKEQSKKHSATHRHKLRQDILDAYGRSCAICGETTESKLTLDHINNDGAQHRAVVGHGSEPVYADLRRRGFPREGFRILCRSCNVKEFHRRQREGG